MAEIKKKRKAWYHWRDACLRRPLAHFKIYDAEADLAFLYEDRTSFLFRDYGFRGDLEVSRLLSPIRGRIGNWLDEELEQLKKERKHAKGRS